jgi:hypothetical protein
MTDLESQRTAELAATEECAQRFLGLTRQEAQQLAEELDRPLRVIDEATEWMTADLSWRRINVYVENNVVVRADAG